MAEQAPATSSSSPLTDDQYDEACDLVGEGVNLVAQFRENKDASLLEKAIANFRDSLRIWTKGHPDRPIPLTNLSNGLWHRFEVEGKMEDLEEALAYAEEAFPLHHPGELGYYATLQLLRSTMGARFEYTNNMEDLRKTLEYSRAFHQLHTHDDPNRSATLIVTSNCLLASFKRKGDLEELEECIQLLQESLQLRPFNHPFRSESLHTLAQALHLRFEQSGNQKDIENATQYFRDALQLLPPGHPTRVTPLSGLANCLRTRFGSSGSISDLEEAIKLYHESLDLSRTVDAQSWCLNELAGTMLLQYDQNASWDDLEESIQLHRRALSLRPFGHRERATSLSNLANSLLSRYKHQGDVKDLDEAIDYYQDALLIIPKNDPIRPLALSNVANGLESRYGYHGRQSDLKEAIGTLREALSLSPPGHVSRFMQASNLASCLGTLYEKDKRLEVLQESIKYHREALSLCSASNPERGRLRVNLAEMLVDEYRETKDMKPLDEAVDFLRQALEDSPSYHPQVADILSVTASAYLAYPTPRESHSISKVDEAFALLQKAASHPTGGIRLRFRKSFKWATLASSHKHNSRLEAYRSCLELLDQYVLTRPSVISRHQHLSDVIPTAVASDAASNAIEMGKLETAVEFLEQGKTILWSQLGRYRTPLDELHKVDKELAMEFERLSLQLETAVVSRGPQRRIGASLEEEARAYKRLSDEWDRLVERIRKLDGFQSFLKAIPFGVVKQASIVGPIIVVNVSETRSDAIIVRYGRPLSHIPLPSMTLEDADRLSLLFSRALATGTEQVRKRKVLMILRMLWSDVVKPIVDHLRSSGVELGSRIWWCVTSKLSSLPIHAAGPHKGNEPNLPDLFVSSYTPTLLALLKSSTPPSSKQSDSKSTTPSLLLVAQPATPGQQQIQSVRDELDIVKSIIPSLDILGNNQGIRDDVLNGLRTHRWVHFASHGSQDLGEPFNARFHLYDKPLTLLDIIQARLPQAEFAFLSACHSAAGDKNTPDETIHLAAGLQFSGFKSVIGTMWRMADIDGPVVAEEVYKYLFRRTGARGEGGLVDYRDAAVALNIARKVLQRRGVPIDRWINFVHIGM